MCVICEKLLVGCGGDFLQATFSRPYTLDLDERKHFNSSVEEGRKGGMD
jgi:hypothetical protein